MTTTHTEKINLTLTKEEVDFLSEIHDIARRIAEESFEDFSITLRDVIDDILIGDFRI